jgi:hypothetical protein
LDIETRLSVLNLTQKLPPNVIQQIVSFEESIKALHKKETFLKLLHFPSTSPPPVHLTHLADSLSLEKGDSQRDGRAPRSQWSVRDISYKTPKD